MLRFITLESRNGMQIDHLDLGSVVYVRQTNSSAHGEDQGLEALVHFVGGAVAQLTGTEAKEFLRQFKAYAERLNLHSGGSGFTGPGHSALSP